MVEKMARSSDHIDVDQCTDEERTAILALYHALIKTRMKVPEARALIAYVLSQPTTKIPALLNILEGYRNYEITTTFNYSGDAHLTTLQHQLHSLLPLTPNLDAVIHTVSETNLIQQETDSVRAVHEKGSLLRNDMVIPMEMMVFGEARQRPPSSSAPPPTSLTRTPSIEHDGEQAPLLIRKKKKSMMRVHANQLPAH